MPFQKELSIGIGWTVGWEGRKTTTYPRVSSYPRPEIMTMDTSSLKEYVSQLDSLEEKTESILVAMYSRIGPHAIHSLRVAALGHDIARAAGYNERSLKRIFWKLLLHDVGKLEIQPELLFKTGVFTQSDKDEMATHVTKGKKFLSQVGFPHTFLDVPHKHHKMANGAGYPHHGRRMHLSRDTRIAGITDRSDAMGDPYRGYGRPVVFSACIARMNELFAEGELDPALAHPYNELMKTGFYTSLQEFSRPEDWADVLQVYSLHLLQQYSLVSEEGLLLLGENVEWTPDAITSGQ